MSEIMCLAVSEKERNLVVVIAARIEELKWQWKMGVKVYRVVA